MRLIKCEITFDINCSGNFIKVATNLAAPATRFSVIDAKFYVSVVTLLTQGNVKLFEQLKPRFKSTTNWNKYQTKVSTE